MSVSAPDLQIRAAVETLLSDYVRALDERRLDDWADCFSEEASYTVIPRSNLGRGLPLCIMADDTKARIRDRVLFVTKIWKENFTDYIPRHIHTLLTVGPADSNGEIAVISNFAAYATEPDGVTLLLAVGEYRDFVIEEDNRFRIRRRQVIVDTDILPRYLVYPL